MAKFCPNCGARIKEGARICQGCGERQEVDRKIVERRRHTPAYRPAEQYIPDEGIKEMFFRWDNRLNRKRFIMRQLAILIFSTLVCVALGFFLAMNGVDRPTAFRIIHLATVPLMPIGLMLDIRRFHDLDKSGWFVLLLFVPLLNVAVILYLIVCKGTDGENQFGPDPLAYIEGEDFDEDDE